MSGIIEIGTVSIVAALSFLLGRFWAGNELIFSNRQKAYSEFSKKCVLVSELLLLEDEKELEILVRQVREAGAEFALYASSEANELAGRYLGKLGQIVAAGEFDSNNILQEISAIEALYSRLQKEMRSDALGWTWFRLRDRLCQWRRSSTKDETNAK